LGVIFAVAANNPKPLEAFRNLAQLQQVDKSLSIEGSLFDRSSFSKIPKTVALLKYFMRDDHD
jgi:hypothetical protein